VTPQGLIAVCRLDLAGIDVILARTPRLLVVLVEPADPGNLGTVIRTADAAGADAVIVTGGADAFGGKAVRASAGSVFHLPLVEASLDHVVPQLREAGIAVLAAAGSGDVALGEAAADAALARPHAWMFGSEAHGLGHGELAAADTTVRVPIYGRAESLNLAAAAAVCLYASAGAQRRSDPVADGSP
jgi:TrmH family RNA methyltransferase